MTSLEPTDARFAPADVDPGDETAAHRPETVTADRDDDRGRESPDPLRATDRYRLATPYALDI